MPPTVAVVGDALLDVRVTHETPIRAGSDIPAAVELHPGGQGANIAVRLARRGIAVRLTCALADDAAGHLVREALAAERVDIRTLAVEATGSVVVLVGPSGERSMLSRRAPLGTVLDLGSAAAGAGWLVVSGYVLLEGGMALAHDALPERRAVVGCALERDQVADWIASLAALKPQLLIVNRDEASLLVADGAASALEAATGAVVVVTDARGATAAGSPPIRVDANAAATAVDTTGAGDAFAAGMVAELLAEPGPWPPTAGALERAMTSASLLAGAVAGVSGAQGRVVGEAAATLSP